MCYKGKSETDKFYFIKAKYKINKIYLIQAKHKLLFEANL